MSSTFCPDCGKLVPADAAFCAGCGKRVGAASRLSLADQIQIPAGEHAISPAVFLSVFIGGWAGALWNQQYVKAIVCLLGGLVAGALTGWLALPVVWVVGIIDSVIIARRLERGEAVGPWQFF